MSYNVYFATHNDQDSIPHCINGLLEQTAKPNHIFIYDDCSTDRTVEYIHDATRDNIHLIENKTPHEYSTARLPSHLNNLVDLAEQLQVRDKVDYDLIVAGDIILPNDYCKKLLHELESDKQLAIISGNELGKFKYVSPRGAGRFIRLSYFLNSSLKGRYINDLTFEDAVLFEAMRLGYKFTINNDIKFIHTRPNGQNHYFKSYGRAMKELQYNKLYVFFRLARNLLLANEFSRRSIIPILIEYIRTRPSDLYPHELIEYMQKFQKERYTKIIRRKINNVFN